LGVCVELLVMGVLVGGLVIGFDCLGAVRAWLLFSLVGGSTYVFGLVSLGRLVLYGGGCVGWWLGCLGYGFLLWLFLVFFFCVLGLCFWCWVLRVGCPRVVVVLCSFLGAVFCLVVIFDVWCVCG